MALLRVEQGNAPGKLLPLCADRTVLGRHPNSDIVLENEAVSRHHARITVSSGRYFVEDLHSRNGTEVNGVTITDRTELCDRDLIGICSVQFSFHSKPPPEDSDTGVSMEVEGSSGFGVDDDTPDSVRVGSVIEAARDDSSTDSSSSIITTLKATGTDSSWRLAIRPESKLRAILKITQALGKVLDPDLVLQTILEQLFEIYPQAEEGFVLLKEPERGRLVVEATRIRESAGKSGRVHISMTIVTQALQSGEAILSADALEDSRFKMSESLSELRIRSLMCVPLLKATGEPMGVLQLDTKNIRRQFEHEDLEVLVAVASQVSLAIENAELHEQVVEQTVLERELRSASRIQMGLLPQQRPKLRDYQIHDFYQPARNVGGDFFDYVTLTDGRIAIAMGDVAGKGIPAALLMARLYSATRLHILSTSSAARALDGLNAEIDVDSAGHRFITFLIAIIDQQNHELIVANAGHLPILRRSADGTIDEVGSEGSGLPLGIEPEQTFSESRFPIRPGDTFLLYTDGVPDAKNVRREMYGRERMIEYMRRDFDGPEQLVSGMVGDMEAFQGNTAQSDDLCVVCAHRVQ